MKLPNFVTTAVVTVALVAGTNATAQTVLKFSNWIPPTHPATTQVLQPWATQVEEVTQGRVKVDLISPLGAPQAHYDLVRNGVADAVIFTLAYNANRFPLARGLEMPFLSDSNYAMTVAAWRTYDKFFKGRGEFEGVKLGATVIVGPSQIYTTKKAIDNFADFKGLKLREAGGLTKDVAEALGATAFFAPAPQVYDVLSKGVGDGVLFPPESIPSFKLGGLIRHGLHVSGGFHQVVLALLLNEAKWNGLSQADRAAIEPTMGESFAKLWGGVWEKTNAAAMDTMKREGISVKLAQGPLLQSIRDSIGPLEQKWVADAGKRGVDGAQALTFYREQIKALEAK